MSSVMAKALVSTLLVAAMLNTVPLPYSEEGQATIAPEANGPTSWSW